jgi:dephospho-CoA kinase
MLTIGLTGGIGSGKSVAAKYFAQLGVAVIDADAISRRLTTQNKLVLQKIRKHFGDDFFDRHNFLNRKKFGAYIFQHPAARHWLEKLLHPKIIKEMRQIIKTISAPYCILVIPLLFETKAINLVDRALVVDCPIKLQIARTAKRSHMTKTLIKSIIHSQISRTRRLKLADDIIHNDGTLAKLKLQVKKYHQQYFME